jgi:hypothetical protein
VAADLDNWAAIVMKAVMLAPKLMTSAMVKENYLDKKVQDGGGRKEKLSFERSFLICMYSIIDRAVHCASTSLEISRCPMEFTSTNCPRPAVV